MGNGTMGSNSYYNYLYVNMIGAYAEIQCKFEPVKTKAVFP